MQYGTSQILDWKKRKWRSGPAVANAGKPKNTATLARMTQQTTQKQTRGYLALVHVNESDDDDACK